MQYQFKRRGLAVLLLAAMPVISSAQDASAEAGSSSFSWNAAVTSEYLYRGISQTDDQPAIQAGAGYAFDNGIYVGAWASNVDFNEGTDAEIDTFIGWNRALSDSATLDVQLLRYNYVGEPSGVDYAYNELLGKVVFNEQYTVMATYTNDYLNSGETSFYYAASGSWELGRDVNLTAGVGYTTISGPADNYLDYSVGVNRDFGPVNVSVSYIGTDNGAEDVFGDDNSEDKFVLAFSVGG